MTIEGVPQPAPGGGARIIIPISLDLSQARQDIQTLKESIDAAASSSPTVKASASKSGASPNWRSMSEPWKMAKPAPAPKPQNWKSIIEERILTLQNSSPGGQPSIVKVDSRATGARSIARSNKTVKSWEALIPKSNLGDAWHSIDESAERRRFRPSYLPLRAANTAMEGWGGMGGLKAPLVGAGAALIAYKGTQMGVNAANLLGSYASQSGAAFTKTPAGNYFNQLVGYFDAINTFVPSVMRGVKRTAEFDNAVAMITGRLPEVSHYLPMFQTLEKWNLRFEAMVKRNQAMTKAGAYGAASVADQVGDLMMNAASVR